ncbi:MAG: hypothetical protein P4L51_11105 [Puia sp.]|nr:hypothetical protein [Puia sp.]
MKKIFLGAALLLLMSATHASAGNRALATGQPHMRNILSSELPASLLTDIKTNYKSYWITELSEEGKAKHPDYSITLENADQIVQLHSSDSENWIVMSTTVKPG